MIPLPRLSRSARFASLVAVALALGACAKPGPGDVSASGVYDPAERTNRSIHAFNKGFDRAIFRPVSKGFTAVVPDPVEDALINFSENLSEPSDTVNFLLQGRFPEAGRSLGRFVINTIWGLGGLFDGATEMGLAPTDTDFGETLYRWGAREGSYVELPFFGPSNQRDAVGVVTDFFTNSFSDKGADDDIVFGWVIGADEIAQPTQKSQFVLISLPAYLTSVELEIQTGWLDRHSEFQYLDSDAPERIDVKLPPNFEAFDTLIIGERQTGPAIFTRLMDEIALEACKPGAVVIPGARLWRSTVVTMNGTMADRITVMPDMQGIVAHFNAVPANVPMDTAYPLTDEPTLHVWTSEGSDKLKGKVKVLTPGPCRAN